MGAPIAAVIVLVARNRRSLSRSGAVAAFLLGVFCSAAGWAWAALLIGFFISGSLLSRYKSAQKSSKIEGVVAKGGERDAWQVLANGGLFSAMAVANLVHPSPIWLCAGAGAIGASSADTWATEIGVLSKSTPRSIITGLPAVPGESGGVTWLGTFASVLGAAAMAVIVFFSGWGWIVAVAAIVGGVAGSAFDSILGATLQQRRWCDRCNIMTERTIHGCGTTTQVAGGLPWLDNDAVNAISSAFGAFLGTLCLIATRP